MSSCLCPPALCVCYTEGVVAVALVLCDSCDPLCVFGHMVFCVLLSLSLSVCVCVCLCVRLCTRGQYVCVLISVCLCVSICSAPGPHVAKQGAYGKVKTHKHSVISQLLHGSEVWAVLKMALHVHNAPKVTPLSTSFPSLVRAPLSWCCCAVDT